MKLRLRRPTPSIGPPPVQFDLTRSMKDYWDDRVRQHTLDNYVGIGLAKFPEDLRAYEHIMWTEAPNVVIELGTSFGASALWFRDRLRWLRAYGRIDTSQVISVDLDIETPRALMMDADPRFAESITLMQGDVRDPLLPDAVARQLPVTARCLVIEDTAHEYETTMAALVGFGRFVPHDGFFVVEDGYVDIEDRRTVDELPRGVLPAVQEWLESPEGRCFKIKRNLEMYGVSSHPQGFLRRERRRIRGL
jgi:cephalosporin hydroxylase